MAHVKFNRALTQENALQGNSDTIYFTTDTQCLIMNGKIYGIGQVIDGKSDLSWGTTTTLATVGGITIDAKLPNIQTISSAEIDNIFK